MNKLLRWLDRWFDHLLDSCSDHYEPSAEKESAKSQASRLGAQVDPGPAFETWRHQVRPWYVSINPDGQPVVLEERVYIHGQEALSKLEMRTPWVRISAGSKEEAEALALFLLTDDRRADSFIWESQVMRREPRSSDMADAAEATILPFRARSTQWKEHD